MHEKLNNIDTMIYEANRNLQDALKMKDISRFIQFYKITKELAEIRSSMIHGFMPIEHTDHERENEK